MVKCDRCGDTVARVDRIPIYREKVYPKRYAKDGKQVIDKGGRGRERVGEERVCLVCQMQAKEAESPSIEMVNEEMASLPMRPLSVGVEMRPAVSLLG